MVEENLGNASIDDSYERMSELKAFKRDMSIKEDSEGEPKEDIGGSLTRRMKTSSKMTDFQILDNRLFPILKESLQWLNDLMVSRLFPENIVPLRRILVKTLLSEYPDISTAEALCIGEIATSIAIDGEGRLDAIHSYGQTSKAEEEKEKSKLI